MKQMMKMMAVVIFILTAGYANAQYKGPGAQTAILKVKEVTDQAAKFDRSDAKVKLQGFVIEQINSDTYWFKDETGKIKVEIEKKYLPAVSFDDKTEVIITGEVDYDLLEGTEIEVKHVEIKSTSPGL